MSQYIPAPLYDLEITWSKDDYIKFSDDQSALIIGYRVRFTKLEYDILKLLFDEGGWFTAEQIIERCFEHKDVGVGNVAVHVFNLNQKVLPVTGRKIVFHDRKNGYRIVENI